MDDDRWTDELDAVDLDELSELYRVASLGVKPPVAAGLLRVAP